MTQQRTINLCTHKFTYDRKCPHCGNYQYSSEALKTSLYVTSFHFNIKKYLSSLRKTQCQVVQPKQISEQTSTLLNSICSKFCFSDETLALALYIYQCQQTAHSNQRFLATAALIVAAKSIELDKNVPYFNRYQRYADKSCSQQEYELAERQIVESINFQLQQTTFMTFLQFYLTCGIVFKDDSISSTLVQFIEDDIVSHAKTFLRKGNFTKYKGEMLALSIIRQIRLKYNMKGWTTHFQELTGYSNEEVPVLVDQSPLKELNQNIQRKGVNLKGISIRKKYQNISHNNQVISTMLPVTKAKQNSSVTKIQLVNRSKSNSLQVIGENFKTIPMTLQLLTRNR